NAEAFSYKHRKRRGKPRRFFCAWFKDLARINTGLERGADGRPGRNQALSKKFKVPLTMF
ncbi:hypothetical protein, partial [Bradyrhizobium sp. ORS 285]|uniref:hypothetical protein n=1 Tax=Bradyrhizobium sp. ORS 285 TaxID=115808 RepID=UPI001AEBC784